MSEEPWIEWHGGKCPVPGKTLVDVEQRGGDRAFGFSAYDRQSVGCWDRIWRGRSIDIVRYRIAEPGTPS